MVLIRRPLSVINIVSRCLHINLLETDVRKSYCFTFRYKT